MTCLKSKALVAYPKFYLKHTQKFRLQAMKECPENGRSQKGH